MRRTASLLLAGLFAVDTVSLPAIAEPLAITQSSELDPYGAHIAEAAKRFELPSTWIRAVMRAESDGDPRAVSPKGAMGLMQLMPETWAELRNRYGLSADAYDPHDNIVAGTAYIRELFDRYGSPGWVAAYNAGPGRYEASLKGSPMPAETRTYVATVASNLDGTGHFDVAATTAAEPLAWIRAPLFILPSKRELSADLVSAGRSSNGASSMSLVRDISAIVPQSGGLFVDLASEGTIR